MTAVAKLQQKMLETSKSLATTVKTHHYSSAKADLAKVKTSNKNLNDEFKRLMEAWEMIKGVHDTMAQENLDSGIRTPQPGSESPVEGLSNLAERRNLHK